MSPPQSDSTIILTLVHSHLTDIAELIIIAICLITINAQMEAGTRIEAGPEI